MSATLNLAPFAEALARVRQAMRKAHAPNACVSDAALAETLLSYGIAAELADLELLAEEGPRGQPPMVEPSDWTGALNERQAS